MNIFGGIATFSKRFGERCPHLVAGSEGRAYDCALHGHPARPVACEWRGTMALDHHRTAFDRLRAHALLAACEPPSLPALRRLQELLHDGTLAILIGGQTMPAHWGEIVLRRACELGAIDHEICALIGLPDALRTLSFEQLRAMVARLRLCRSKTLHREILERYIDPFLNVLPAAPSRS